MSGWVRTTFTGEHAYGQAREVWLRWSRGYDQLPDGDFRHLTACYETRQGRPYALYFTPQAAMVLSAVVPECQVEPCDCPDDSEVELLTGSLLIDGTSYFEASTEERERRYAPYRLTPEEQEDWDWEIDQLFVGMEDDVQPLQRDHERRSA